MIDREKIWYLPVLPEKGAASAPHRTSMCPRRHPTRTNEMKSMHGCTSHVLNFVKTRGFLWKESTKNSGAGVCIRCHGEDFGE